MDKTQLNEERPNHKSENVYFADTDGSVWKVFGCTDNVILAHACYWDGEDLMSRPMAQFPFDRFGQWVDRKDIVNVDGEASFAITATAPIRYPNEIKTMPNIIKSADGLQVATYTLAECRRKYGTCDQDEIREMLRGSQGPNVRFDVETDDCSVTITTPW